LEPEEFRKMVENIRNVEKTQGSPVRRISREEVKYRELVRRKTVAKVNIPAGKRITRNMLAFKRSRGGLSPVDAEKIIGKTTKIKLKKDEPITWNKVS
jgi:sialic acid synthase SpsE